MDGIEKIKRKIAADAAAEAKKVAKAAKQEATLIKKRGKERRAELVARHEERMSSLLENHRQKTLAAARLDAKKTVLAERERLIEILIEESIRSIDHAGDAYRRFLERTLANALPRLTGDGITIRCAQQDIALVSRLATRANILAAPLEGGVILEDASGRRIDESLRAVIARRRDTLRQEAAAILGDATASGPRPGDRKQRS